ncbi:alpha/beta fold hydrolase [Nonomuraea sp. NPDC002799]
MVIIDGVRIAYDETGPDSPAGTVVLVHAGVADRRMWDHRFLALAERYRVIRYDWRGQGRSGDAEGEVCHHEDLLAVMDALGVERAALVGGSMGGAYATEAALAAPSRVAALALIGSGLAGHSWPAEMLEQARKRVHTSVPAGRLARYHADEVDPADVRAMAEALRRADGPDACSDDGGASARLCRGARRFRGA